LLRTQIDCLFPDPDTDQSNCETIDRYDSEPVAAAS
jgi:hypothetical protein